MTNEGVAFTIEEVARMAEEYYEWRKTHPLNNFGDFTDYKIDEAQRNGE